MLNLPDYQIIELIHQSANSLIYRGHRREDRTTVVLKVLRDNYPTLSQKAAMAREFEINRRLNLPGVLQVYALKTHQQYLFLELENFSGKSLTELNICGTLTLEDFLLKAIAITKILGQIHQAKVIHKDINPSNILYYPPSNCFKIIDFGLATILVQENVDYHPPSFLEGTLPYISPEQTGRMNRPLDYRSDFYSLGVTFYHLLTGCLPFNSNDVLELIHSHLALTPPTLEHHHFFIPLVVQKIIFKLLAKNPEERYQSAQGLEYDLQLCLEQLYSQGNISDFSLATHEGGDRFLIPPLLYGRDLEIATLLNTFAQVCSKGVVSTVLISGESGVGKSALVKEVHKPLTASSGDYVSGKYDQYQRNIPYSGITLAFNQWCNQILKETEFKLQFWQNQILAAVGDHGQILIDIIPNLELIIDPQPPVDEIDSIAAQHRLNSVFLNFLKIICTQEHPLVLFIDDLQWADAASINLLTHILTASDLQYFLFIGAYRHNELTPSHPWQIALNILTQQTTSVTSIHLNNLTQENLNQLIADTLNYSKELSYPLSKLIYSKTQGNSFYSKQLLSTIYQQQLIKFDYCSQKWRWELAQIYQLNVTNNVVDLMSNKIINLSPLTQEVLQLASCIGNSFNLEILSGILHKQSNQLLEALLPALEEGLVLPLNDSHKFILAGTEAIGVNITFKFLHDRVQQAAYSLIDEPQKQILHLSLGRLLLFNLSDSQLEDKIFAIVSHFNRALKLISDPTEKIKLAQLNYIASQKAKSSNAYEAMFQYVNYGLDLITHSQKLEITELTKNLYLALAESNYVLSNFEDTEKTLDFLLTKLTTNLEKASVITKKILLYTNRGLAQQAVNLGIDFLTTLGLELPKNPSKKSLNQLISHIETQINQKTEAELINLPPMSDPEKIAIMDVLIRIGGPAYFYNFNLYYWLHAQALKLALDYGNASAVVRGYCVYGFYRGTELKDYHCGYKYGQISSAIASNLNNTELKGFSYFLQGFYLNHWCKHLDNTKEVLTVAYQLFRELGNLAFACFSIGFRQSTVYFAGLNLTQLEQECQQYLDFVKRSKFEDMTDYINLILQAISTLKGVKENNELKGDRNSEIEFQTTLQSTQAIKFSRNLYYLLKLQLAYLAENYSQAWEYAQLSAENLSSAKGLLVTAEHSFYYCLTITAKEDTNNQYNLLKTQKQLKQWAQTCPDNFQHKFLLIEAEKAKIQKKYYKAQELYDQAINLAHKHKYIQDEAIANELAALHYLSLGKIKIAGVYLKDAHYCYETWGAYGKVQALETKYPELLTPISSTQESRITTKNTATDSSNLDFNSILKASQAISREIKIDDLLAALMKLVIENAGADKGYLILPKHDQWFLEAYQEIYKPIANLLESIPLERVNISQSIVNYVIRTQTILLVDKPAEKVEYKSDRYILENHPKAILCTPLENQGKIIGLLYLENQLTAGVFTTERLNIINMLSSQATISLENARLYLNLQEYNQSLEKKVAERTAELLEATHQAQEASKAKSSFLANMSHELRSPLNAILGFAQLMKNRHNLDSEQKENIAIISRSGEHLLNLINQVLDLSKIESGKIGINENNFDLYQLLEDLEDMFSLKAEEKKIKLKFFHTFEVPRYVRTDEIKLRQILINLISNALKFTHSGWVYLRVTTNKGIPLELVFEVEDSGVGIAPEELDKIFEAFVQSQSGKKSFEGTGLGLTISRRFIQIMGGDINFTSELNKGSSFRFHIPIILVEKNDISNPQSERQIIGLAPNQPQYCILVADDKLNNRILLNKILTPLGFEVIEASNGEEAIKLALEHSPNLILMDVRMPVMEGYEATKRIKATPLGKNTPIIALTASILEEEKASIMSAGCDDFMRKPFKTQALLELIAIHLNIVFVYDNTHSQNHKVDEKFDLKSLNFMSKEWLLNLEQAALEADSELVLELISQISPEHEKSQKYLSELVNKFQFEKILELIEESINE